MKSSDLRSAWRSLIGAPTYSVIAVGGLVIGFAVCFLLLGFVRYSVQYNAELPDPTNTYIVKQRYNDMDNPAWYDLGPCILRIAGAGIPGVRNTGGFVPHGALTFRVGQQMNALRTIVALQGFTQLVGPQAVQGSLDSALDSVDGVALTESAAARMFGNAPALGQTIVSAGKPLRVTALVRDPPANSTIRFDVLIGIHSALVNEQERAEVLDGSNGHVFQMTLLQLQRGADRNTVTEALQRALNHSTYITSVMFPERKLKLGERNLMDVKLGRLADAYFDQDLKSAIFDSGAERGNPEVVAALALVGIIVLALATINFVNLFSVRTLQRQREIAVRKVLGLSRLHIAGNLLAESLLIVTLSASTGLLTAWLCLPMFGELMHRDLQNLLNGTNLVMAAVIALLVAVASCWYPVWIALSLRPLQALADHPQTESRRGTLVRRATTVCQIAAALALSGISVAIVWQANFALHAEPGFDTQSLLIVDLPDNVKTSTAAQGMVAALRHQPEITGVAVSLSAVGRSDALVVNHMNRIGGETTYLELKLVSANFFQVYGLKPTAGRLFDPRIDQEDQDGPILLNTLAAKNLGFASPEQAIGQQLVHQDTVSRIVGIVPDIRFNSLHQLAQPIVYQLSTDNSTLTVRAADVTGRSMEKVEQLIREQFSHFYPDDLPDIHRADDVLKANYEDDDRLAKLLLASGVVALALSACGIYGLMAYSVQRRSKELVIRKLYGATDRQVVRIVAVEAGILLLIALVPGLSVALFCIARYLSGFVEHAPIGQWPLLAAVVLVLATITLATARSAWHALRLHPRAVFSR